MSGEEKASRRSAFHISRCHANERQMSDTRPLTLTCKRVGAQILSLGAATGGLAGGFEGAAAKAQEEGKRPGPWLWQEWPWGAAAAEGGRHLNPLEGTRLRGAAASARRAACH